jgi:hypothetical protein
MNICQIQDRLSALLLVEEFSLTWYFSDIANIVINY